jgi:hypothetical protein
MTRTIVSLGIVLSVSSFAWSAAADEPATPPVEETTAEQPAPPPAEEATAEEPATPHEETAPAPAPPPMVFTYAPATSNDADTTATTPKKERFRAGALAGVGFPRPFAIEGFAKIGGVVGLGVEYSFLPRMNVSGVETSFKAVAADLRLFPFKGGFFVGARAGRQWLDAKTTVSAGSQTLATESMDASTWFVNPRIGFLHTFESGITIGIDAGVQIPIAASYSHVSSHRIPGATGSDETLRTVANTLGQQTTPTIDLLRVGFLF